MSLETNLGNSSFRQTHKRIQLFDALLKGYLLCSASKCSSVEFCATATNTFQSKRNWGSRGSISATVGRTGFGDLMASGQAITVRSHKKPNNGKT